MTDWTQTICGIIQAICAVLPFINKDSKEQNSILKKKLELHEKKQKDKIRPNFWFEYQTLRPLPKNHLSKELDLKHELKLVNKNELAKNLKLVIDEKKEINLDDNTQLTNEKQVVNIPENNFQNAEIRFKDKDGNSYKQTIEKGENKYILSTDPEEIF